MLSNQSNNFKYSFWGISSTGDYSGSFVCKFVSPSLNCEFLMSFKTWHCVDMYYLAFPTDPKRNKLFVYSVFILEVIQTIIITQSAFHVFGEGYGNLAFFYSIDLTWFSVPIITGIGRYCIAKITTESPLTRLIQLPLLRKLFTPTESAFFHNQDGSLVSFWGYACS